MSDQLPIRFISSEWTMLLEEAGRLQYDACATLERARREPYGRMLHLRNGGKVYERAISTHELEMSLEAFAANILRPALESFDRMAQPA
jgi:hypothetical protein